MGIPCSLECQTSKHRHKPLSFALISFLFLFLSFYFGCLSFPYTTRNSLHLNKKTLMPMEIRFLQPKCQQIRFWTINQNIILKKKYNIKKIILIRSIINIILLIYINYHKKLSNNFFIEKS